MTKLYTITNAQTTVEIALKEKYINSEQKKNIDLFFSDPPNWGNKMGFI